MHELTVSPWASLAYLVAGVCFILALRGLSSPASSQRGNRFGIIGMTIAVVTTLVTHVPFVQHLLVSDTGSTIAVRAIDWTTVVEILAAIGVGAAIGLVTARRIAMTAMPQLVAAFHSLVGLAAVLVGVAAYLNPQAFGISDLVIPLIGQPFAVIHPVSRIELGLGVAIGAITFSGSVIAFLKLNGNMGGKPIMLPGRHVINIALLAGILGLIAYFVTNQEPWIFWTIVILSFVIGFLLIVPIGGADMPVVVSMLNSYSGWAAAAMGFTLHNSAMIITGALVGSSGAILSYIMCRAMNRSFISVIAGGFGAVADTSGGAVASDRPWKRGSAEDAAFLMSQAEQVIIVPGYGMAVAQAQHVLREMGDKLKAEGVRVKYAIHPVAGRMPGHMNVLLAEANVPYDDVFELEDINSEFAQTDVAFVIGANDVTNPAAKTDKTSPIYGMPVLDVEKAKTVLFIKRSMGGVGYAGVDNELFYRDNTMMLLADAKKMVEDIVKALD
ncbi:MULTISPECIES: NAD(P)(+) transhydrogenase (Re/Si-specific) subunit beta [unclassified Sphingomonas]|uniref:NAD(P)(+) transhydrogenase (Re/Si-specific) subunit beta n=1 Tax=unclassified Sphingomonas TaxID=196159 RepID=UPI000E729B0E|nr:MULTISPECIES: NAD(P)(+) transhydrogenase (Re/Si-specific) subunit beta [unclassified Sphingomonas]RKE47684.1 NAD/NADP transhydrogenase beta subunit [Sphingomonas sp. PP-CC-1A-547]TCM07121.1 NAD/NADP transhydrogenase beta subunit [Sphingomonas sp. PP-CC-3G-468]